MTALVVIPTYDERENVETVLTRVRAAAPDVHVLIVDDNSPDGTADLADEVGARLGQISVLRRPGKAGLGSAYRAGFAQGLEQGFDVLVEMDADLSHDPEDVPRLLAAIDGGADLAIGSRYVPGGTIPEWPLHRRLLSRWGNRYVGFVLHMPVRDATAGFRAYRGTLLEKLETGDTRMNGYAFQVEMAYASHRAGAKIVEVPISFRDRVRGTSKMSGAIVAEAMTAVTRWGIRDRILHRRAARR